MRNPILAMFLLAPLLLMGCAEGGPGDAPDIFLQSSAADAAGADARGDQIMRDSAARSVRIVRVNTEALRSAGANSRLTLNLSPEVSLPVVTEQNRPLGGGRVLWKGEVEGNRELPQGEATFVISGENVTGTIAAPSGTLYQLRPLGNGETAVLEIDYSKLPPDEPHAIRARPGPPTADVALGAADANPVIDLLVAYTPAAASASGDINSLIDLAVTETNTALANSSVNATVRIAGKLSLTYSEAGKDFDTILAEFKANSTVNSQLTSTGADMGVLIMNQSDFCGMADNIGGGVATAYLIVHFSCATGYYSFGHEIGHIMGNRHDMDSDSTLTPFAYGHAHLQKMSSGGWRTVMGYNCASNQCPTRIQYFSNPSVSYSGNATGEATREDNARVWRERAPVVAAFRSPPAPAAALLYQLHGTTGRIFRYTGTPCSGSSCPGWQMLDNNPASVALAANSANLYQLHNSGRIFRYTGTPCSGSSCPGWQMLDNNPASKALAAAGTALYQLHSTGRIFRFTGTPCSGSSCPGWQMLDNNPASKALAAAGTALYQLHSTGRIFRFTGTPCSGSSCPGWQMLDNNPATKALSAGGGGALYQIHTSGRIFRFTGTPCSGSSCPGWQMLDNNPASTAIFANGAALYQRHSNGRIFRFTGTPCSGSSCPGWQMLDNNPATVDLAGNGSRLFQRHNTGRLFIGTGAACSGSSCPGWIMIDNNPATRAIVGPTL